MRTPILESTKEEIRRKLLLLYSDPLDTSQDVLDFDKKYDFFSTDKSVLKYSSNWFTPDKYSSTKNSVKGKKTAIRLVQNDGSNPRVWHHVKQESLLRIERAITTTSLPKDLEILGKTPYHLGVEGEKFRVVAATLQKCNSPLVRRTFHFTSNGIVEASEKKNDMKCALPFGKQTKSITNGPKFVRIKRFRIIRKDEMGVDKYAPPQEIKLANNEKTGFLTVRIRPKISNTTIGESPKLMLEAPPNEEKNIVTNKEEKEKSKVMEPNLNLVARTEEVEEETTSEAETVVAEHEEEEEDKTQEVKQTTQELEQKEKKIKTFNCGSCGKQFQTYLSCLAHFRSHQRQVCQFCSKKFLTVKMLRDHIKVQHQQHNTASETPEGRITTATSKFGRTRQVLNVAELRTKYKML